MAKLVNEPTYKRFITQPLEYFNEDNNGYSRSDKGEFPDLRKVRLKGLDKAEKNITGYTRVDFALGIGGVRAIDNMVRRIAYSRDSLPARWQLPLSKFSADPTEMSEAVKYAARWFGADLVGICKLNRLWVYSQWGTHNAKLSQIHKAGEPVEIPEEYQYAVVMAVEMDYNDLRRSPAVVAATELGYSKMAFVATSLAEFIRYLGHHAIPAGNDMALSIPLAIDAGLGELGRSGILITEEYGPRVRLCKVFTDLPLVPDKPIDFGLQHFCETCHKCADNCPGNAILHGERTDQPRNKSNNFGVLKWPIDAEKCLDWWVKNGSNCNNCTRVCPWNKPKGVLHKVVRSIVGRTSLFDSTMVKMDDILGYGKQVVKKRQL